MSFVTDLQRRRASYNNCEQARMQAESLKLLSSGIYTEEERFIYELLQNAVDAFQDTKGDSLSVQIEIIGEYLIFAHNGKAFTEKDIEGLCDVGNGNKMEDKNKIGYKGIGFKSVFMKSSQVFIQSGGFSFKFDKEACPQYMPNHLKGLTCEEVPWQVIPIESPLPFPLPYTANVITCLKLRNSYNLAERICTLIGNPEFLLFLNAPHICISFTTVGKPPLSIEKNTTPERVELLKNQKVESQWLVHSRKIPIPIDVIEFIKENKYSFPEKLRNQTETEVSFAIRLEDGQLVESTNTVAFTYLPTSFGLALPFLINANFMTDAGRQQLSDSPWNHSILYHAAFTYLQWMAVISQKYPDSFYNVLPNLSGYYYNKLATTFKDGIYCAIKEIPFLPSKDNPLCVLKTSEAFIDRINIADIIGSEELARHINRRYNTNFSSNSRLRAYEVPFLIDRQKYNIFAFDMYKAGELFKDDEIVRKMTPDLTFHLMTHFYNEAETRPDKWRSWASDLQYKAFILNNQGKPLSPRSIALPSTDKDFSKYLLTDEVIHLGVYTRLQEENPNCLQWFIQHYKWEEASNMHFIDSLLGGTPAITPTNAIQIGRLLFRIVEEEQFFNMDKNYQGKMRQLPFLTKQSSLKAVSSLYLGKRYHPNDNLEEIAPEKDIYISEEYIDSPSDERLIQKWKLFFKVCGANDEVTLTEREFDTDTNPRSFDSFPMLKKAAEYCMRKEWEKSSQKGYETQPTIDKIHVRYFFLVDPTTPNEELDKFVLNKILAKPYPSLSCNDKIYYSTPHNHAESALRSNITYEFNRYENFLEYAVAEIQQFPTTMGKVLPATEIYLNTEDIRTFAGKYFPLIDIEYIHKSWYPIIPFKRELILDDYLAILERIQTDKSMENITITRNRIQSIYTKIIEQNFHIREQSKISEWGKRNKILSEGCNEFCNPSELYFVDIKGFNPRKRAFTGEITAEIHNDIRTLLECLGVQVITKVFPKFYGLKQDVCLKELLLKKLQYLAVLKEVDNSSNVFEEIKTTMTEAIESYTYYHCDAIRFSYGDDSDTVKKSFYSNEKSIYYCGTLIPIYLQPLVSNILAKLLGLNNQTEEVLTVLISPSHQELVTYLDEKGYNTSLLTMPATDDAGQALGIISTSIDASLSKQEQYDAQLEAQKILMQTHSKWKFPSNYGESGSDGTPLNYSVTNDIFDEYGKQITVVLKSYRDETRPFHINANEWEALCNGGRLYLCVSRNSKLAIEEYDLNDLIIGQDKIRISFDATNLDPNNYKNKTQAFVNTLRYFSGMTFDFQRFVTRPANLYARREGSQTETNDNDL